MILGICGLIGSGKGTVSDILEKDHGFIKISFADSLKDVVSIVFGWDRNMLEGDTIESRAWREKIDPWWANKLNIPSLTPRWVLQFWGTEVCRYGFHEDIWIASLERKLITQKEIDPNINISIPDTRFQNEINMIKNYGGQIWHIQRGTNPDWLIDYIQTGTEPLDIHPSEWNWARSNFKYTITNDGTLEDLKSTINKIILRHK